MDKPKPHIAIIGTRGIPARYGGFETFAEELSTRLLGLGYQVTVYCRSGNAPYEERTYKGVKLVVLPTLKNKFLDTVSNTFLSVIHVLFTDCDVIYFCNAINSIFIIIPRIFAKKTVINVDGLEWKRKKWNKIGKLSYRVSEWIATIFADRIITDSRSIQDYYRERFHKQTVYIPYGVDTKEIAEAGETLHRLGLSKRNYLLYISRLEPENNAHILIKAYEMVKGNLPLVIVGDAPYAKDYIAKLRLTKDRRIKFVGSIYGIPCQELRDNAYLYVHGNEVGGTNPALLEAMASGNCVIVNGVPFNKEVIGEAGFWYEPDNTIDLKNKIEYLLDHPEEAEKYRQLALERVRRLYNWEDVTTRYEKLFATLFH